MVLLMIVRQESVLVLDVHVFTRQQHRLERYAAELGAPKCLHCQVLAHERRTDLIITFSLCKSGTRLMIIPNAGLVT